VLRDVGGIDELTVGRIDSKLEGNIEDCTLGSALGLLLLE
jgi:hypothetical protein